MKEMSLARRCVAEALGTGLLVAAVVGSGIMAQTLCRRKRRAGTAVQHHRDGRGARLVDSDVRTDLGCALQSGRDLWWLCSGSEQTPRDAAAYVGSQAIGGVAGTVLAHLMFALAPITLSTHVPAGWPQGLSEVVATFGLVATILSTSRHRPEATPFAVSAFIAGAYWFTASTSFANPAVTIARSLTDTFAGIRPADVPLFVVAELVGAGLAASVFAWLLPVQAIPTSACRAAVRTSPRPPSSSRTPHRAAAWRARVEAGKRGTRAAMAPPEWSISSVARCRRRPGRTRAPPA